MLPDEITANVNLVQQFTYAVLRVLHSTLPVPVHYTLHSTCTTTSTLHSTCTTTSTLHSTCTTTSTLHSTCTTTRTLHIHSTTRAFTYLTIHFHSLPVPLSLIINSLVVITITKPVIHNKTDHVAIILDFLAKTLL